MLILNDACAIWLYVHERRGVGREKTISGVSITSRKSEGRIEPILEWRGCHRSVSDEVRAWLQVTELCNTGYRILTAWMPSRTRSMPLKDDRANPNQFPVKSAALRGRGGSLKHVGLRSSVTCCMRRSRDYLIGWARRKVICLFIYIFIFFIKLLFLPQGDQRGACQVRCIQHNIIYVMHSNKNLFHISHTLKNKIDLVHPFPGLTGTAGSELQRKTIIVVLKAILILLCNGSKMTEHSYSNEQCECVCVCWTW